MPFTVSHVITSVPLRRLLARRAVASALVIGTLVPDYRHFIPGHDRLGTHDLAAILWFALPVGLASYFVFHALLRAPALALLPVSIRQRLGAFMTRPPASERPSLADVALSLMAGAASHLGWDAFTHHKTFVVEAFPAFFYRVFWRHGSWQLFGYGVLQHVSSLVGLWLLVAWCRRWLARQPADETIGAAATVAERVAALGVLFVAPAIALVARFVLSVHAGLPGREAAPQAVCAAGIVLALGVTGYGLVWRTHDRGVAAASPTLHR